MATVAEVFDTVGLVADLRSLGPRPLPMVEGTTDVAWGSLDFIVRYGRDGRPGAMGPWQSTLDPEASSEVTRILRGRVRELPALMYGEGYRAVVDLSTNPSVVIGSPVVCAPHIRHEAGLRPLGLPEDVVLKQERRGFRPRPGGSVPANQATVRIHLDRAGTVTGVDSLAGTSSAVARAIDIVSDMTFDPALRNGEGIASDLVETFTYTAAGR